MPVDVELAIEQLYEDPSLRDEISDDPAGTLLKWAEKKLVALAEKHDNEEAFEEEFATLRQLIKSMNRFTARERMMDEIEKEGQVGQLVERAQALGLPAEKPPVSTFSAQALIPEEARIHTLIEMLDPSPTQLGLSITEDPMMEDEDTVRLDPSKLPNRNLPDELA